MTQALLTHHLDQQSAEIREWCADNRVDIDDPKVARAIKLVTDWVLVAGYCAEPDSQRVANAMFLMTSAWRAVVE